MSQIFDSLVPIFLIVALGAGLVRIGLLTGEALQSLNRLVYWVALPALLFVDTARANLHGTGVGPLVLVLCCASIPIIALGLLYARLTRLPPAEAGTLVHVAMRGNLAYVGLPVLLYLSAAAGPAAPSRPLIILAFAPLVLYQNVVSILLLLAGRQRFGLAMVASLVRGVVTNPLLVAVALGLLACVTALPLPGPAAHTLDAIGAVAAPLALIGIGGSLLTVPVRQHWGKAAVAAALKVGALPLVGLLLGLWLGLPRNELVIALVFLACPTGVSSHPLVAQMDGDEALASTAIVISTLLSIVPLALIVGLM